MTDEVNRGFQGFIKNLCRGVMIDIWLPSDVHATDIMNGDKEVSAISYSQQYRRHWNVMNPDPRCCTRCLCASI